MALWQFRVILLPEQVLLRNYGIMPLTIPMEVAEDSAWWSDAQPLPGFERQIDFILPAIKSWSDSMRMWGQEDGNDAYVSYVDKNKSAVEEIAFRVDARAIPTELVGAICNLAMQLGCVLMTASYEILRPEESTVLKAIGQSTAKKFVDDPVSTLRNLDQSKIQDRLNHFAERRNDRARRE